MFPPRCAAFATLLFLIAPAFSGAQASKPVPPDTTALAQKGITLAKEGHCSEALPPLRRGMRQLTDKDLKRTVGLTGERCAMALGEFGAALDFLQFLAHEFPHDPDVLYTEVHAFSDLSTLSSQELARTAHSSPQAHKLLAETYESQGKWEDAEKEYRHIVEQNPDFPGIHFRLGRLMLSKPNPTPDIAEAAKHEFEKELAIDPSNAGAEYVLGELARQSQQWDQAVAHFSRATKLDAHFGEAFLGLGVSLMSLKRYSDALVPLETAVRLEPGSPDAHYNLATAYTRSGRKQDGEKEFAIHQKLIGTQGGAVEQTQSAGQAEQK